MTGGSQALGNQPRKKARIEVEGEEDKTQDTEPRIIGGDVTRCGHQYIQLVLAFFKTEDILDRSEATPKYFLVALKAYL